MRNIFFLAILLPLIIVIMASCSTDVQSEDYVREPEYTDAQIQEARDIAVPVSKLNTISDEMKELRAAVIILSEYIELEDSVYYLNISREKASFLGVSRNVYDKIVIELDGLNAEVADARAKGETIILTDMKAAVRDYKEGKINENSDTIVASRNSRVYPKGRITTIDQSFEYDSFETEFYHSAVLFECRSGAAPFPFFECSTSTLGAKEFVAMAGVMLHTTNIVVPLALTGSRVRAKIGFRTSDSNGGAANWSAK